MRLIIILLAISLASNQVLCRRSLKKRSENSKTIQLKEKSDKSKTFETTEKLETKEKTPETINKKVAETVPTEVPTKKYDESKIKNVDLEDELDDYETKLGPNSGMSNEILFMEPIRIIIKENIREPMLGESIDDFGRLDRKFKGSPLMENMLVETRRMLNEPEPFPFFRRQYNPFERLFQRPKPSKKCNSSKMYSFGIFINGSSLANPNKEKNEWGTKPPCFNGFLEKLFKILVDSSRLDENEKKLSKTGKTTPIVPILEEKDLQEVSKGSIFETTTTAILEKVSTDVSSLKTKIPDAGRSSVEKNKTEKDVGAPVKKYKDMVAQVHSDPQLKKQKLKSIMKIIKM